MAATVIDELIVTLGLDASKFTKGQQESLEQLRKMRDESEKAGKQVEKSGDTMSEALGGVTRKALELTSVFLTGLGIKNFLEGVVRANTQLGRTADVLGQSVTEVGKLTTGTYLAGGSIGGMTGTLKALNDQIALVKMGAGAGTGLTQTLSALKISLVDSAGHIKTNVQLLREMTQRLHELNVEPSVAVSLLERAGIAGDVIPQMLHGVEVFDRFNEQAAKLRNRTPEDAAAAGQLTTAWRAMTTALEGLGDKIVTFVANPLSKVLDLITNIIRVIGQNSTGLVGAVLGGIFGGVAGFLSPIPGGAIAGAVGGAMAGGYLGGRIGGSPNYTRPGADSYSTGTPGQPGSINAVPGAGSGATPSQNLSFEKDRVRRETAQQFRDAGIPETGVGAVLANVQRESGFNPNLRHPDQPKFSGEAHYAHGLYQEGGTEWNNYAAWLARKYPGRAWQDPKLQTEFLIENLKKNYPKVWAALNDPNMSAAQKAMAFQRGYLKPAQIHGGDAALAERYARNPPAPPAPGEFAQQQPIPFMQSPAFAPGQPGVTNNSSSVNNSRQSSAEINVKELNVAPPPAADPNAWAKELVPAIKRAAEVTNWDFGPN